MNNIFLRSAKLAFCKAYDKKKKQNPTNEQQRCIVWCFYIVWNDLLYTVNLALQYI